MDAILFLGVIFNSLTLLVPLHTSRSQQQDSNRVQYTWFYWENAWEDTGRARRGNQHRDAWLTSGKKGEAAASWPAEQLKASSARLPEGPRPPAKNMQREQPTCQRSSWEACLRCKHRMVSAALSSCNQISWCHMPPLQPNSYYPSVRAGLSKCQYLRTSIKGGDRYILNPKVQGSEENTPFSLFLSFILYSIKIKFLFKVSQIF